MGTTKYTAELQSKFDELVDNWDPFIKKTDTKRVKKPSVIIKYIPQ